MRSTSKLSVPEKSVLKQIIVNVTLGQHSKDCENFGVCKVDYASDVRFNDLLNTLSECNNGIAILSLDKEKGLDLAFLKTTIRDCCAERFFSEPFFKVQETFHFSDDITKCLQVSSLKIEEGLYPIQSSSGFYIVQFV